MPIVFQQPSPMAPDIVSAAGAAEQWSKDAPMLARMYESAQSGQTQASIASAHNATQMNAAQLSESGRDSQAANVLEEHARQFDESRQPSRADAYHAQAAMAQQQQRAELGAWLNQQDLSQAEGMRLQRLQGAVGHVMADESLDPETKQNLLMQLKTGIDPLRQRAEMQKAKLESAQAEKAMHDVARQEKMVSMNQAERARDFHSRTVTEVDPATGESHFGWIDDKGNFQAFKSEKKEGADRGSMAFSTWTKFEEHATNMAMKQQEAEMKAWEAKVKEATANEKEVPVFSTPDMQSRIAANMKRLTGYSSYPEMLQGQQGMWKGHGLVPGQSDQPAPDPQGGMGQAPVQQPTARAQSVPAFVSPPLSEFHPDKQKEIAQKFDTMREAVKAKEWPEKAQKEAVGLIDRKEQLIKGGIQTPADKQMLDTINIQLEQLELIHMQLKRSGMFPSTNPAVK